MKILIVSDAWQPQINGVVRTLQATVAELRNLGHETLCVGPEAARWCSLGMPTYPGITLEFFPRQRLGRIIEKFEPAFIHIATEGPLGWAARSLCLQQQIPFTTSYHTRFPEYLAARAPFWLAQSLTALAYTVLRRFHAPSSAVMAATASIEDDLRRRKFRRLVPWSRGVDTRMFRPYGKDLAAYEGLPRPILLYVGRVAIEKNLRGFLDLKADGSKIVIGDGPDLEQMQAQYPHTHFLGFMDEELLARHYAAADLFVFPSMTETFGLVLLEACACGLRIASVVAPGPADIFADNAACAFAVLDNDLGRAVERALLLPDDPAAPRRFAERFSWISSTQQFFWHLQAPTPAATRRMLRFRGWLSGWWRQALALAFK